MEALDISGAPFVAPVKSGVSEPTEYNLALDTDLALGWITAVGADLISDALQFGRLWYGGPNAVSSAVDYAKFRSRSHDAPVSI